MFCFATELAKTVKSDRKVLQEELPVYTAYALLLDKLLKPLLSTYRSIVQKRRGIVPISQLGISVQDPQKRLIAR